MNDTVFICIPGEPQGKGRPRVRLMGKGKQTMPMLYTPKETVDYEVKIACEARMSMGSRPMFKGPVELTVQMFMTIPASWPKKKREAARLGQMVPTKKIDADNCAKVICDALNGVLWVDDVQVVDLHVTKRFSEAPSVMVQVRPLRDLIGINDAVPSVNPTEELF